MHKQIDPKIVEKLRSKDLFLTN